LSGHVTTIMKKKKFSKDTSRSSFREDELRRPEVISGNIIVGSSHRYSGGRADPELEAALRYFDENDKVSVERLFDLLERMINQKRIRDLSDGIVIEKIHLLLQGVDLSLVLRTTSMVMRIITIDENGTFCGNLVKGEGISSVISHLPLSDSVGYIEDRRNGDLESMVISNVLCLLGHVIPYYGMETIVVNDLLDRLVPLTSDRDEVIRGNAYFCIRMMIERDPEMVKMIPDCPELLMRGVLDSSENVQIEGLLALYLLIERDLIEDENICLERAPLLEHMSHSSDREIAMAAEQILFRIERKAGIELE